ncbi:hypothetical protein SAMN05661010_01048 [Modicisalibacter muralis]|uniref:DUF3108 domain-containing protein n=1 Tax=Modicisalibacter muralis TaxID=119000 RepID=A0A1G9I4J2_9GAMM|nr:hypothetical protein [Halomonas muralis]SDL20151.1 hypothetical protein SAMN05661010_01048 [Halomonas muralis]
MRMPLCKAIGVFVLLAVFSLPALAGLANPVAFQATYHLSVDGWPDARISHRLSQRGEVWQSEMRAAISIAKGDERSRFRIEGETTDAESYASGYNLLGFGERYRLTEDDLSTLPDRQTALFALSRRAPEARCTHDRAPCTLHYLGYKGEEETLRYRVIERGETRLPPGTFPSVTVDSWDPEKPDRHLVFTFHRKMPGLLLAMEYRRDGERQSRLTLTQLTLSEEAPAHQQN